MNCIRGATTVSEDKPEEILEAVEELLLQVVEANKLKNEDIISIIFTATKDLASVYPAVAARKLGLTSAALMCTQEMYVEGSLPKCIRIMVTTESGAAQKESRHIYLRGAVVLRPDLHKFAVAIDGPSGVGKSTTARSAAEELGFIYVDTGAMYRAVGLYCSRNNVSLDDYNAIGDALKNIDVKLRHVDGVQRVFLNGEDVSEAVRTRQAADGASKVAVVEAVREKMVSLQREIAKWEDVVMDGRDIATVVLPWAQVKIYLDASVGQRSLRRLSELKQKGLNGDYESIKKEMEERDFRDSQREHSPLRKSEEAVLLDTSELSPEEVTRRVVEICKAALQKR